jgi:CubicO group peptidase (beta-lactamase class C family)
MRVRLVLSAAVAGLLLGAGVAHGFSWDEAKQQQALKLVRQFQATHRVPSLALGVTVDGRAVLTTSLDADGAIVPGGENLRYRIGSVTKQFTAAGILALIEDKVVVPATGAPLTMDTSLGDIFPRDVDPNTNAGRVSVKRLLTMTSNIPNYTDDAVELRADATGASPASRALDALQIIQRLKGYSLSGPPLAFEYSNTNYFILAFVIHVLNGGGREATDIPVRSYLRRRILAKAGMIRSGFVGEPTPSGYADARPGFLRSPRFSQGDWPKGAGDIVSTAADMARWNVALMSGNVINERSVQTMLTPVAPVTSEGLYRGCLYAMGWYVCERSGYQLIQHDGIISGFMASNAIGRQSGGSWMSVTLLGNIDATQDIVALTRSIIEIGK